MKAIINIALFVSLLITGANSTAQYTLSTSTSTSTTTTTTSSPSDLFATPSRSTSSYIQLSSVGAYDTYYYRSKDLYMLYNTYASTSYTGYADGKPYARLYVYIQKEGNYLVSFRASAGSARMRHNTNGYVVGNWSLSGCNPCDYSVPVALSAGGHYFYFWATDSYKYVYSASVAPYSTSSTSSLSTSTLNYN